MKIWALTLHTSVGCISLRMPAGPHFVTQPILLSENILMFDINHQQNTRRSDQIGDKNDNANYAPSYHMEGLPMAQVAIFKEIFDQVRVGPWIVLFLSQNVTTSHIIFTILLNIHIVLENDNTVLIKGLKRVVNVKFSRNTHHRKTSYDRLKSREMHFSNERGKILLKRSFRWVINIHEHIKDITMPLIIHYYLLRAFRTLHKSFHAKS